MENKTAHSIGKDSKAVEGVKTERLDLGFLDKDEAIQLGLIVPKILDSNFKDSSGSEKSKHPITPENENININNENQLDSSELSVFSLKSYTQITESTVDKTTQQGESSAEVINNSNANVQVDSNECSIDKEIPMQSTSFSGSISSPDTCLQVDKVKNTEDKMNGYSRAAHKRGIIVNPHCCEDKLLSGYCGYSVKNINEEPKKFKHRCNKQHVLRACHFCM